MEKNINWKEVSKCPGYKSLKAAYIKDVQKDNKRLCRRGYYPRGKDRLYGEFKRVIWLIMKFANKNNMTFVDAINQLESKRTYRWVNYYYNSSILTESVR